MHSQAFAWLRHVQHSEGLTIQSRQLKSQKHFVIHRVQCMKRRHPMIIIRVDLIKRSFCSPVIPCPLSCRFRMAVTVAPTEPGVAFSTLQALKILILKGSLSVTVPESVFRCLGGRHLGLEFRHPSRVNWRADELQRATTSLEFRSWIEFILPKAVTGVTDSP